MSRQTKLPEGVSRVHEVADAVVHFPLFAFEYVVDLFATIATDITMLSVALAGVTTGYATGSWEIGLAVFFVLYSILRIAGNVADAIGFGGNNVASALGNGLVQHGNAIHMTFQPTPEPGTNSDVPVETLPPRVGVLPRT